MITNTTRNGKIALRKISAIIDDIENAAKDAKENNNPKYLTLGNKSKTYTTCTFYTANYNIISNGHQLTGWFEQDDLSIPFHRELNEIKVIEGDKKAPTSTWVTIKLEESGLIGRLALAIDDLWKITFENSPPIIKKKSFHSLITRNYPDNLQDETKAGMLLPHPLIRMKVDFRCYPDNHPIPILRSRPMTLIYNADKPIIKDDKIVDYELMTTPSGETLTINNLHEVITRSTYIKKISLDISALSVNTFASLAPKVNKIWISIQTSEFINLDEINMINEEEVNNDSQ